MGDWQRMARYGAAREFGRRHYRLYALAAFWRQLAVAGGVIVGLVAAAGGGWWLLQRVPAAVVCLIVAGGAVVVGGLRLAWLLTYHRGPARGSGGLGWALAVLVSAIVGAIWLS